MKVDLIDRMGTDLTVVNAARVSFAKESDWANAKWGHPDFEKPNYLGDKDIKLIKYLATHGHWTPFSHVQLTMREKVPLFVARQRFKHMIGFTYNEVSRRYVDEAVQFFVPETWRLAPENAKQGSGDNHPSNDFWQDRYAKWLMDAHVIYEAMIEQGVAPEQARMVLPQSMYTEYYVTGSLAAWARAYKLRIASDAQKEIQDLAKQWDNIIRGIPELKHSWDALTS